MADQPNSDPFKAPDSQPPVAPAVAPSQDPFADQLTMIKNDNGDVKYDSVPKALEALQHSQQYIPQLKDQLDAQATQLASLQAELDKRASVEDVVSRLQPNQQPQEPAQQPAQVNGLDEQAVAALVQSVLAQKEQATATASNRDRVNGALTDLYGDKASEAIAAKAVELGTSVQNLSDLANTQPDMILALFNTAPNKGPSPTTNSYNIPPTQVTTPVLEKPTKSLLSGATAKEQAEYMAKIRAEVFNKFGVTE